MDIPLDRLYLQEPHWANVLLVIEMFVAAVAAGAYFAYGTMGIAGRREDSRVMHWLGLVPLPLMLLVAVILIVDLGQPLRFLNLLFTAPDAVPQRGGPLMFNLMSPMSWGTYVIALFGLFALVAFVDSLSHLGKLRQVGLIESIGHNKIWQAIGGFFALMTGSYSGVLLNVTQQTVWSDTVLQGALYTSMAALCGVGLAAIVADRERADSTARGIREAIQWVIVINIVFVIGFLVTLGPFARIVAFTPEIGIPFWVGLVVLGLVVPLWIAQTKPTRQRLALAGWLTLVGALTSRYVVLFSAAVALHG